MSPDLLPSLLPVPSGGPQPTGADKSLTAPPILQPDVPGCIQLPQALPDFGGPGVPVRRKLRKAQC